MAVDRSFYPNLTGTKPEDLSTGEGEPRTASVTVIVDVGSLADSVRTPDAGGAGLAREPLTCLVPARRAGFEPATSGLEVPRSIRAELPARAASLAPAGAASGERVTGIEPA